MTVAPTVAAGRCRVQVASGVANDSPSPLNGAAPETQTHLASFMIPLYLLDAVQHRNPLSAPGEVENRIDVLAQASTIGIQVLTQQKHRRKSKANR